MDCAAEGSAVSAFGHPMRAWLASVLRDEVVAGWPEAGSEEVLAVSVAVNEGVVSLLHQRLYEGPCASQCPPALQAAFATAARTAAMRSLAQIKECRRLMALMAAAGIPALLLKGSALACWLYPAPNLRECGDIDLLLRSRRDVDRAIALLSTAGYSVPVRTIPGDLVSYQMCVGADSGLAPIAIDLHWKLCNTPLFCDCLQWEELLAAAIPVPYLGGTALGLSPVHALLHACLHRANNLQFGDGNRLRWLYDLKLLAQRLDAGQWRELLSLAQARGAAGACVHGLLAAECDLGAEVPAAVLASLTSAAKDEELNVDRLPSWLYAQWATARALPTWRLRLRWIRQRLLPDRDYLREQYSGGGGSIAVILWRRIKDGLGRIWAAP
jgi:hypothetical protein